MFLFGESKPKEPPKEIKNPIEIVFRTYTRPQLIVIGLLFLGKLPAYWQVMALMFINPKEKHICLEPEAGEEVCPCTKWEWKKSAFTNTVNKEFELICDKFKWRSISNCLMYVGCIFGAYMFGAISDKIGRKYALALCYITMGGFGVLTSFVKSLYPFLAVRFLQGLGSGGAIVVIYVLLMEFCGTKQREMVTILYHVIINLGHCTVAWPSYFLRAYDDFHICISVPCCVFAGLAMMFIYESPKWLMDVGKIDECVVVIQKTEKWDEQYGDIKATILAYQEQQHLKTTEKLKIWHIFRYRQLTINYFCMIVLYFMCGAGYYGVAQFASRQSDDVHMNTTINGFMLVPATLSCFWLLPKLSRRFFLMSQLAVTASCVFGIMLLAANMEIYKLILASIGSCCYFNAFLIVFLYVVELFPTTIRNEALGSLSVWSRFGQSVAPLINDALPPNMVAVFFGGLAVFGAVLCIPLTEAKGKDLPSSLQQAGELSSKQEEPKPGTTPGTPGKGVNIKS